MLQVWGITALLFLYLVDSWFFIYSQSRKLLTANCVLNLSIIAQRGQFMLMSCFKIARNITDDQEIYLDFFAFDFIEIFWTITRCLVRSLNNCLLMSHCFWLHSCRTGVIILQFFSVMCLCCLKCIKFMWLDNSPPFKETDSCNITSSETYCFWQ